MTEEHTFIKDTSATRPNSPAIEGSSTRVFDPLTEFNASIKARRETSFSREVSNRLSLETFVVVVMEAGIVNAGYEYVT